MARKSILELIAQVNATFPDNSSGLITPAVLRAFCIDFLTAVSPAYAYMTKAAPSAQVLGLVSSLVVFSAVFDSDPAQTTTVVPASTITRAERGTSTINFTVDMECITGRFVTFTIFKNGVATPWRVTGNGGGTGNPVAVALTAVDYADPAAVYSVQATCETNGTSVILSNMGMVLAVEPVRSYT